MIVPDRLEGIARHGILQMKPSVMQFGNAASTVTHNFRVKPRENHVAFHDRAHLVFILPEADACATTVFFAAGFETVSGSHLGKIAE